MGWLDMKSLLRIYFFTMAGARFDGQESARKARYNNSLAGFWAAALAPGALREMGRLCTTSVTLQEQNAYKECEFSHNPAKGSDCPLPGGGLRFSMQAGVQFS